MPGKLTDTAIRGAKPLEKAYKLADGGGLYLGGVQPASIWKLPPVGASGGESNTALPGKRSGFPWGSTLPWACGKPGLVWRS